MSAGGETWVEVGTLLWYESTVSVEQQPLQLQDVWQGRMLCGAP